LLRVVLACGGVLKRGACSGSTGWNPRADPAAAAAVAVSDVARAAAEGSNVHAALAGARRRL
jgi:inosine-uridine nucleoside N-ribohydrolase